MIVQHEWKLEQVNKGCFLESRAFSGCFCPRPEASESIMNKVRLASKNRMIELLIKI